MMFFDFDWDANKARTNLNKNGVSFPLAEKHRDHALSGDWKDHRDCRIRPDLVLIYRKPDDARLQLVRLGSQGELGL